MVNIWLMMVNTYTYIYIWLMMVNGLLNGVSIAMGVPQKWIVDWENPVKIWMMTGGTPMTQETSISRDNSGCTGMHLENLII